MTPVVGPSLDLHDIAWQAPPRRDRCERADARPAGRHADPVPPAAQADRRAPSPAEAVVLCRRIAQIHARIGQRQQVDDQLAVAGRRATRLQELANEVVIRPMTAKAIAVRDDEYQHVGAMLRKDLARIDLGDEPLREADGPSAPPGLADIADIRLTRLPPDGLDRISRAVTDIGMRRLEVRQAIRRLGREVDGLQELVERNAGVTKRIGTARAAADAAARVSEHISAHPDSPPARPADATAALMLLYDDLRP